MNTTSNKDRVPFISKIAYGMGDVGCNFSWMFVSNFLMIFYTDVFGIGMSAVATLMLVSRIWDAVIDPMIGTLTDKTHTRWGRFRPWLLFGAPITAIILMLTFWAHPHWSQTAKIVYMAVTYCILVLGYTCVNLPYGTLCGAMTQNIDERAKLNTSRSVSAMIAIGVLNIITVPLVTFLGKGNAQFGYLAVAIIYGIIFAACHLFRSDRSFPYPCSSSRCSRTVLTSLPSSDSFSSDSSSTAAMPTYSTISRTSRVRLRSSAITPWPSSCRQ